jgi:transposase InsO family protein
MTDSHSTAFERRSRMGTGKPIDNALAETFIGRLRDECLNEN